MTDLSSFPITKRWPAKHPELLQLYSLPTPNGVKVSIMLEEIGLPYEPHRVDFDTNDQASAEFRSLNPYGKIPAIIDPAGPGGEPLPLFESGAILVYLAEKSGQFLPRAPAARYETLQWLMFQVGGLGPLLGQAQHFRRFAPRPLPYAIERYTQEAQRLYGVLERRLEASEFLAGSFYSIADIAAYPWVGRAEWQGVTLADLPQVRRWFDAVGARPAVQRGMRVPRL